MDLKSERSLSLSNKAQFNNSAACLRQTYCKGHKRFVLTADDVLQLEFVSTVEFDSRFVFQLL